MDNEKPDGLGAPAEKAPNVASAVDRDRRRLTTAGVAGVGVMMTLNSRSALGAGFGQCGSESVSAALSRHGELSDCGCSPGFWWNPNGLEKWNDPLVIPDWYGPRQVFNEVFQLSTGFGENSIEGFLMKRPDGSDWRLEDLGPVGGPPQDLNANLGCSLPNLKTVVFHAVAALLNASFYGARYPASGYQNPDDVIAKFADAARSGSDACYKLREFLGGVDVYNGTWCFGDKGNQFG